MSAPRLAAWLDSYRTNARAALQRAAEQGFRFVRPNAATGDLDARGLTRSARRDLRRFLGNLGLGIDGLALEHPGRGLADPAHASERVDQLRHTLEFAAELDARRAGVRLVGLEDPRQAGLAGELLAVVAEQADRVGVTVSVHDPTASPAVLSERIRALGCPLLVAGLDTAQQTDAGQLIKPVEAPIGTLYLRDGRRRGAQFEEVDFGEGDVDFAAVLGALAGHEGEPSLVVRRDAAATVDALARGREYIASLLARSGIR